MLKSKYEWFIFLYNLIQNITMRRGGKKTRIREIIILSLINTLSLEKFWTVYDFHEKVIIWYRQVMFELLLAKLNKVGRNV